MNRGFGVDASHRIRDLRILTCVLFGTMSCKIGGCSNPCRTARPPKLKEPLRNWPQLAGSSRDGGSVDCRDNGWTTKLEADESSD